MKVHVLQHVAFAGLGCSGSWLEAREAQIGLQFHLETTPQSVAAILKNCRDELIPGPFVQSEADLLAVSPGAYESINALMSDVLSYLTSSITR